MRMIPLVARSTANVRARLVVRLSAKQAKVFGLKPPRRSTSLIVGTGTAMSTRPGQIVKVSLRFTRAFRAAFARTIVAKPTLRVVVANLSVALTRGGLTTTVNKTIRLTR